LEKRQPLDHVIKAVPAAWRKTTRIGRHAVPHRLFLLTQELKGEP